MSSFAVPQVHQTGPDQYSVSHGNDTQLIVEFTTEAVYQEHESKQEGRAVYKDIPFIKIRFPGDKTREVFRPVRMTPEESVPYPPDPERFPRQWGQFKNQQQQSSDGMPIEHWPPLTKARVMELKAAGINTVEQIAGVIDTNVGVLGLDGRELRDKAKAWLDNAAGGKVVSQLSAQVEELKNANEALRQQFAALAAEREAEKKAKRDKQAA